MSDEVSDREVRMVAQHGMLGLRELLRCAPVTYKVAFHDRKNKHEGPYMVIETEMLPVRGDRLSFDDLVALEVRLVVFSTEGDTTLVNVYTDEISPYQP